MNEMSAANRRKANDSRYIYNPYSGQYVLRTGVTGRHICNNQVCTSFKEAAERNNLDAVKHYLELGITDDDLRDAIDLAKDRNNYRMIEFLSDVFSSRMKSKLIEAAKSGDLVSIIFLIHIWYILNFYLK